MKSINRLNDIVANLNNQNTNQSVVQIPCQVCGKQSNYSCFDCQATNYCSKDHQQQHWRKNHKINCKKNINKIQMKKQALMKQIYQARKNYYQNYGNKIYTHCLLDVKLMTGLSKQMMNMQPENLKYRLDYGASICLIVRTYKILNDITSAKHIMQEYLKCHNKFLYELDSTKNVNSKISMTEEQKQQLQMKLNLISGIANISYAVGLDANDYYVLYTKYVISCFGEDSFQASNCFFLIGCYFSEEGWFQKAIACFEKSAKIRGQFAGDCMYNIGVLYKLMNNLPKALSTLEVAMKLREQQYGEDSNQVAEVNQLMGNIYTQLNDYKTALSEYEKAFRVRSVNTYAPEYQNILSLIHELYNKLCLYIKIGQPNMNKPQIYIHLKQQIEGQQAYWQNQKYKKKKKQDEDGGLEEKQKNLEKYKKKKVQATQIEKKFSWKDSGLFTISQQFVSTLNLSQLFRLSQLQLEMETCDSVFNLAYIIGTSVFFETLRPQKRAELQKVNFKLFQLMRMQDIKKIKHMDK